MGARSKRSKRQSSVLHDIWLELRTSTNLDRRGRFLEQVRGTPLDVAVEERIEQVEGLTTSAKTAEWLREARPILETFAPCDESMGWRQAGPAPDAKRFEAHLRMLIERYHRSRLVRTSSILSTVLTEYPSTTLHHGVPIPDDCTLTAIFPLPGSKWGKTERVKACRRPGVSSSEYNREGFGEISSGTLVAPEVVLISDTAGNDGNAGYSSTDPL